MERTNKIYVIGTLIANRDVRTGVKDGKKWIAGTAVIKSGDSEIELKYFSTDKTKDGAPNKRFANYESLDSKIDTRIRANGELAGRVFYNAAQGQIINFNEVSGGFFNEARPTDEDVATFEFGGYVIKPLHERLNKEEKLIAYEIELGQANYNGDGMQIVKFTIDKDSPKIINAIQNSYSKGTTVQINGSINYIVSILEKTEEVAFGEPIVKSFSSVLKTFLIAGGKQPIIDETAYTALQINKLEAAYRDFLTEVEREAKTRSDSGADAPGNAPSGSSTPDSLL